MSKLGFTIRSLLAWE